MSKLERTVLKRHEEIVEEWYEYVKKRVYSTQQIPYDDRGWYVNYLILEIIKASQNRWKYADFKNVIYATINRRLRDVTKKVNREKSRNITENRFSMEDGGSLDYVDFAEPYYDEYGDKYFVENLRRFAERVFEGDLVGAFNSWEKECLEVFLFLYDNNCSMENEDVVEMFGEDVEDPVARSKITSRLTKFREKMKEYTEELV